MGKSTRASSIKANRATFRKNVSGPKEQARLERLHAKLAEVAAKPVAAREETMQVDAEESLTAANREKKVQEDVMDVDGNITSETKLVKKNSRKTPSRIQKKKRSKPVNQMKFPSLEKRKALKKGRK